MTIEEVRKLVHRAPFQPFTVHLADGSSVLVPHPDFIALSGAGRTVVVTAPDSSSFEIIDLLLATKLEIHGAQPAES